MILGYIVGVLVIFLVGLLLMPIAIDTGKKIARYYKSIWK